MALVDLVYWPIIGVARTLFLAQGLRFTIVGEDNVPRSGGAVMAINHTGYLDFTYAGYAALPARRLVRFMAKESVFDHQLSGPLMRGMKHIPVDRTAGAAAYRHAVSALQAGEIVGVYPEATISRSFELKDFKLGAARMAQEAGVPILPTTVWGAQRVWTKGHPKNLGRTNTPIFVTVGEPMPVGADADIVEITAELKRRMQGQLDGQQAAYPPMRADEAHLMPARLGGTAPTLEQAMVIHRADAERRRDESRRKAEQRAAAAGGAGAGGGPVPGDGSTHGSGAAPGQE